MIKEHSAMREEKRPNMRGGQGVILDLKILEGEELPQGVRLFSKMQFKAGDSIGTHPHIDNVEFYYILKGEFAVTDDGETRRVGAGDMIVTGEGHAHSIVCVDEAGGEFLAVIVDQPLGGGNGS